MKTCCFWLLGLFLVILSGCVSMSGYKQASLYEEASLRHHAYATATTRATAAEWRALVSEFQKVIDADVQGPSADDAQYAIASSWMWSIKVGDTQAPQQAIKAFRKLIHTYPNSEYRPLAHYWLGRCYAYINDNSQAFMQYQVVGNRYADSEVTEPAKLELARAYARQGYSTRAETSYKSLVDSSMNQEIGAAAAKELQVLATQQTPVVQPPKTAFKNNHNNHNPQYRLLILSL